MRRWKVLKRDYDPRESEGYYPWEVEGPDGHLSDVFESWEEAFDWAAQQGERNQLKLSRI